MPLNLASTGGGSVTLQADSTASAFTQTIPAVSGTNGPIVQGTAQATTSGTSFTFSSIPSWVKRITIMFQGVAKSGTSAPIIQIGAGSTTTTGYTSAATSLASNGYGGAAFTNGFPLTNALAASTPIHGSLVLTNLSGNTWTANAVTAIPTASGTPTGFGAGALTLGGTLDRVIFTSSGGTDTFSAGSVNILYE